MEIKISDELYAIINFAREEAMRTGSYGISPDHLFLGILRQGDNTACTILKALDTDLNDFKQYIDRHVFTNEQIPFSETDHITFSRGAQNILSITVLEATRLNCAEASSQHLLLALCRNTGCYGQGYLRDIGVDYGRVISFMEKNGLLGRHAHDAREEAGESNGPEQKTDGKQPSLLEMFGTDLTQAAAEGKLDPVEGREEEMKRVIQILGRRKKNNPMLVGDPGAGKSAIVEGIASRIASGDIPASLKGKRIVTLDILHVLFGKRDRLHHVLRKAGDDDIDPLAAGTDAEGAIYERLVRSCLWNFKCAAAQVRPREFAAPYREMRRALARMLRDSVPLTRRTRGQLQRIVRLWPLYYLTHFALRNRH